MGPESIVNCANYISACMARIAAKGMLLEIGSDFETFADLVNRHARRGPLTPKFDPAIEPVDGQNAFWILGRNELGEIVHTQAIRIMDIGEGTLAEHIREEFPAYTPPKWRLISGMNQYNPGPGSHAMRGRVCYHGDFWILGGDHGFRGRGMNVVTSRLAMAIAMVKWNPDYIYAYMHSLVACSGVAPRGGFMHMEQNNLFWSIPGYDELLEAWMVWSARRDIMHFISASSLSLADQLGSSRPREFRKHRTAA